MSLQSRSDSELMDLYKKGDMEAFGVLYSRYERRIYNFFLRFTGSPEDARDLLQITFLKVHSAREEYHKKFALSTWIFTIARNVLTDRFREDKVRGKGRTDPFDEGKEIPFGEDPEDILRKEELKEAIQNALKVLPPDQRLIILLSRYEDMSYEEIARILNTTTGAVKVKAHRACKVLKEYLKNFL